MLFAEFSSTVKYTKVTKDYHDDPKFSDSQVWANNVGPDQTAPDQGPHCLQFPLHLLDTLL